MIFDKIISSGEHEQVTMCYNKDAGLKAIIAIHNTSLGPALGGVRLWNYNSEEEALTDVLRLSKGMTYKAAASGLNLGGGKAVIIGDKKKFNTELIFRAFGQFVNSLNGKYITAEDVGTNVEDMENIHIETPWVTGISMELGGSGDPSPYTAMGVLKGIEASVFFKYNKKKLKGMTAAIQGVGSVGSHLASYLHEQGVNLIISDIDEDLTKAIAQKTNAKIVSSNKILFEECDILAPCALGGLFDDQTIPKLKTKIIAGGANNQLVEERHGKSLADRGILYAPDYIVNAGGLMNVYVELEGYSSKRALELVNRIYNNIFKIYTIAKNKNCSTNEAANEVAKQRIGSIGSINQSRIIDRHYKRFLRNKSPR